MTGLGVLFFQFSTDQLLNHATYGFLVFDGELVASFRCQFLHARELVDAAIWLTFFFDEWRWPTLDPAVDLLTLQALHFVVLTVTFSARHWRQGQMIEDTEVEYGFDWFHEVIFNPFWHRTHLAPMSPSLPSRPPRSRSISPTQPFRSPTFFVSSTD